MPPQDVSNRTAQNFRQSICLPMQSGAFEELPVVAGQRFASIYFAVFYYPKDKKERKNLLVSQNVSTFAAAIRGTMPEVCT